MNITIQIKKLSKQQDQAQQALQYVQNIITKLSQLNSAQSLTIKSQKISYVQQLSHSKFVCNLNAAIDSVQCFVCDLEPNNQLQYETVSQSTSQSNTPQQYLHILSLTDFILPKQDSDIDVNQMQSKAQRTKLSCYQTGSNDSQSE
ncbi:Hypothetical_protein [Hexamita inflata]|uniref:Hypothetical_protein n=1 Tax=Hexamita inflata TaxID=28002 RepID=A0AA86Q4F4_9EUKA|nr:Hypothetical protein HINF_LOCUS33069 [Hexamita inflata]